MKLESEKFVLLKNRLGSIFWTTDDGANYEAEGFIVLYRGNTVNEMTEKWSEYNEKRNTHDRNN